MRLDGGAVQYAAPREAPFRMSPIPACPECGSDATYPDAGQPSCAACGHAWDPGAVPPDADAAVRDCNGVLLAAGDTVVVTRDLKVKGSPVPLKQGTLIRNIRLVEGDTGHVEGNIEKIRGLVVNTCYARRA